MFEKLQTGEKFMMHQDSLEPAAIRFTLERLQESARRSGCNENSSEAKQKFHFCSIYAINHTTTHALSLSHSPCAHVLMC